METILKKLEQESEEEESGKVQESGQDEAARVD